MLPISVNINSSIINKNIYFKAGQKQDAVSRGDNALNNNKADEALSAYKEALAQAPDDVSIQRKMGKAYYKLKDYNSAAECFKKYIEANPEDSDCLIELGETQRQNGYYELAIKTFESAYGLDNSNDLAKRSILESQNNLLGVFNPQRAYEEKNKYASNNLKTALDMTVSYMTPEYMSDLSDVTVQFGKTAEMGGTSNIAQYENGKNCITVSDSYIYASPQVIAAYLSHESVHAKDKDPYTSVREEQDAYEVAAKFWISNSNGVKDPEMDYAANLYRQSPAALDARVAEIYKLRDPSIAETSPNHPPQQTKTHFWNKTKSAASQPVKPYNVIA